MLKEIRVSNIALIQEAQLQLAPGMTVLSGETGAGKTALLFSLKMLMGERADSYMVRDGAPAATVEGVFQEGDKRIEVRRRLGADGRSRCWIDGEAVSVGELARRIGPLLELHGQHEHQTLLDPSSHVAFLDTWIGAAAADAKERYRSAFAAQQQAKRDFDELLRISRASQHDIEDARYTLRQIQAVAPLKGEYEELEAELPALQHVDSLATATQNALDSLRGEGGVSDELSNCSFELGRIAGIDAKLDQLAARLDSLAVEADDIAMELRAYNDSLERDPQALQERLDRLGALDGLCRRFGPRMQDVFDRMESAQRTLALVDDSQELLADAQKRLDAAEASLQQAAGDLATLRGDASDGFSDALTRAVADLGMKGASFVLACTDLPRAAWTAEGSQHLELLYSPGTGVSPRPLAKIASGGELSRVMLALKGAVDLGDAATLVFDEIDAGIGGTTAILVGERLAQLANDHQLIVVTHLAQIAAHAQTQLLVTKQAGVGRVPQTSIRVLEGEERVTEIARMLSGTVSEAGLQHARALLEG